MLARREALIDDEIVRIGSSTVYLILTYLLLKSPYRWTSSNELADYIWGNRDNYPASAKQILSIHMGRLREHGVMIETRYGWGYRIPCRGRYKMSRRRDYISVDSEPLTRYKHRN